MNTSHSYSSKLSAAFFAALLIFTGTAAQAGWTGIMNGAGVGWASVNVRSSTFQTNRVTTGTNMASRELLDFYFG